MHSAILEYHIIVGTSEPHLSFEVAGNEKRTLIHGMVVNVIKCVISAVEVNVAILVGTFSRIRIGIITNHSQRATIEHDIVCFVGVDVVVQT